jgi:hypothetical protein
MASWVDDFTSILDSAAGVVNSATGVAKGAASVLQPVVAAASPSTPPPATGADQAPKQALVANNEAKKSTFPWGWVLGAVVVLALVEYS